MKRLLAAAVLLLASAFTAPAAIAAAPTFTKSFSPATVGVNGTSTLTFNISNNNFGGVNSMAFSDTLPSGLIVATPNGATNSCNGTLTAVAGSGSISLSGGTLGGFFGNCAISVNVTATTSGAKNNTTSTLTSSTNTAAAASATLTVLGPASKVVFGTQPSNTAAGAAITPAVTVHVEDASGNVITNGTGSTASVTIAIGTNPGGGTLSGTQTVNAVAGTATFSTLSINKTGTGYTLTASSSGLTGATSNTFNITPGTATQLIFTTEPSNSATAGTAFPQQPVVTVEDANGNTVTGSAASILLAITAGTGTAGAALSCTTNPLAASAGVASFAGCSINLAGNGYTLRATSGALTAATSSAINVSVGAATKLAFTVQPTNTAAGSSITPSVAVSVEDAGGNVVTSPSVSIAMAIGTNPGGGILSGTTPVNTVNGVATFSNLSINKSGTGYTLSATSSGLATATSNTFNITAGTATQLVFTTQPGGTITGGVAFPTQPTVTVEDTFGNTVTTGANSTATITLAITNGTGTAGATLTCTANPKNAAAGVDTFAGCAINLAGTGYTLTATATGLTPATSTAFNVSVGPAAKLAFVQQPTNTVAGSAITPAITVQLQDAGGNSVTTTGTAISMAIGTNPGGGTLSGTTSQNTVNGLATFNNLSINKTGTGYTLTASSTG